MSGAQPASPLAGWYVISLRPLGQHASVRRAARRLGARVFALSPIALEATPAGADLVRALACPIVVVTSPAAARLALAEGKRALRGDQRWFAVGPGTAAVLRRHGITGVAIPGRGASAEALLALPALAHLPGVAVGVLTAPGGRGQLAKTLARRGAEVHQADVYRRVPIAPAPHRLRALAALPAKSALLVSSEEALASLWRRLPEPDRVRLRARPCVASSERLAAAARVLGFRDPWVAASAQPARMVATLADHARARRFR